MTDMTQFIQSLNIPQLIMFVAAVFYVVKISRDELRTEIKELRTDLNERIDRLDERIDRVEERINRVEERINRVEEKLDMKISTLYMMLFKTSIDDFCPVKPKKTK